MKYVLLCLMCVAAVLAVPTLQAAKKSEVCINKIHVIKGCPACEAMQEWLRRGGVELERTDVDRGAYKLYPTVVYSDKTVDHGERMYKQEIVIPGKICVVSCSIGTN